MAIDVRNRATSSYTNADKYYTQNIFLIPILQDTNCLDMIEDQNNCQGSNIQFAESDAPAKAANILPTWFYELHLTEY